MRVKFSLNYRFYSLGWRSRLHFRLPLFLHLLFSISYLYRLGYQEASEWIEEYCPARDDREFV